MQSLEMEVPQYTPLHLTRSLEFEERRKLCSCPGQNHVAFWLLGLLNNSSYVIMIAGANSISSAAVGLVYLCAVLPGVTLKASAPYWFHLVSYSTRIVLAAALMGGSFTIVALSKSRSTQLLGVVLASLQSSLGEASCLALTTHYSGATSITSWSSGTGFAGVFGYAWVALLHIIAGLSFKTTLLMAWTIVCLWVLIYFRILEPPEARTREVRRLVLADSQLVEAAMHAFSEPSTTNSNIHNSIDSNIEFMEMDASDSERRRVMGNPSRHYERRGNQRYARGMENALGNEESDLEIMEDSEASLLANQSHSNRERDHKRDSSKRDHLPKAWEMTAKERFRQVLSLWPFTIPLMSVYFAEYAMQSGAWTAIGFPVSDERARKKFYVYANWSYQAGVFVSRSSGTIWQAGYVALWVMPVVQCCMLAFFLADAVLHFWYNWSLMAPCFMTGLLGGAVYVNAFTLITKKVEPRLREFSLGAASVADGLGVAMADAVGILIQGCLFRANGLEGADFKCSL